MVSASSAPGRNSHHTTTSDSICLRFRIRSIKPARSVRSALLFGISYTLVPESLVYKAMRPRTGEVDDGVGREKPSVLSTSCHVNKGCFVILNTSGLD